MAGNLLWAHLLPKDARTTDPLSQIPPIAPQDKTGTSVRMLIHDTHVNLEKFSARLDGLLQRVDDCRTQVVNANKLLDVERDKVLTEILEIANRCQSEMKTHVGVPAQSSALDLLHVSQVSTEKSMQALEKRIDALQTLLQTHAYTMQSIQDQQNTLIGAVLPLVPIFHSVPPQMDQIKTVLTDMVANAVSTMTNSIENVRTELIAEFALEYGRAGPSTRVGSPSKSISSTRRKRSNASASGHQEINAFVSSPLDSRSCLGPHISLKRARIDSGTTQHAENDQMPRKLSRFTVPLVNSGDPPPLPRTPRTPRRPHTDLLLPSINNTPSSQRRIASHLNSTVHGCMRPPKALLVTDGPSVVPMPIARPPLRPIEQARPDLQDATITRRGSAALHDMPLAVDKVAMRLTNTTGPLDQDAPSKAIKIEEIEEPSLTSIFSVYSSPPSSSVPVGTGHGLHETSTSMTQPSAHEHLRLEDDTAQAELVQVPLSDPFSSNPDASPPKSMSLRDRRAQMSRSGRMETRRFVPLAPWSDEEE